MRIEGHTDDVPVGEQRSADGPRHWQSDDECQCRDDDEPSAHAKQARQEADTERRGPNERGMRPGSGGAGLAR